MDYVVFFKGIYSELYSGVSRHTIEECYEKHGYFSGHVLYKPQGKVINNIVVDIGNAVKFFLRSLISMKQ